MSKLIWQSPGIYKKPGDNNLYDSKGNLIRGTEKAAAPAPAPKMGPPLVAAPPSVPTNFNWQEYLNNPLNADLRRAGINSEEAAKRHYLEYGQKEGRQYGAFVPPTPAPTTPPPSAPATPPPPPSAPAPTTPPPAAPTPSSSTPAMPAPPENINERAPTLTPRGNWQYKGVWVNKEGYKVDGYGNVKEGQKGPFVPPSENYFAKQAAQTPTPAQPAPPSVPTDFNWEQYLNNPLNADLRRAGINTEEAAKRHYLEYGQKEGRQYGAFVPPTPAPTTPPPAAPAPTTPPPAPTKPPAPPPPTPQEPVAPSPPSMGSGLTMETPPLATEIEKPAAPEMVNASAFGSTGRSKEEQMSADVYKKFMDFYTNFDPTNIYKNTQTQFDESMQRAGDAIYNEFTRRAEPEFARQRADLERVLIERGLDPSGEQFTYQMNQLAQQQNDARQSARNQAVQQGIAYQAQLFGQGKDMALMPMSLASQVQAPALAQGEFARTLTEIGARGTEERKGIQLRGTEERKTLGAQLEADLKKLEVNQANEIELAIKKGEISLAEARERIAADVQIASSNNVAELEQIAADARNKRELLAQQQVFDAEQARVKAKEDERLLRIENRSQEKIARITRPRGGAGELSEKEKAQKEFDEAQNRALLLEWQAKMKQKGLPSGEDIFWNTFRTKGEQEILRQMEG